jgi:hypothetical protein
MRFFTGETMAPKGSEKSAQKRSISFNLKARKNVLGYVFDVLFSKKYHSPLSAHQYSLRSMYPRSSYKSSYPDMYHTHYYNN